MTVYGVIGVGAISAAIVRGLCRMNQAGPPPSVLLSPRNAQLAAELAEQFPTVQVAQSNQHVVDGASVLLLCLRPQDAQAALSALIFRPGLTVISVMAGFTVRALADLLAPVTDLARSIPLPAVELGEGVTPLFPSSPAANALFSQLGTVIEVPDERTFEALSASTATVAAMLKYMETTAAWLAGKGIPASLASRYVAAVFSGVMTPLQTAVAVDFGALAHEHQTPGGLNEQFLGVLEQAGIFRAVEGGLNQVLERLDPH
ncbi:NAD(P)-binding domain-containing protein [Deinococcus arenicola]|uniref:NAD(P)-binding domain-containing protein n=1 Tax=Deinococcus arenicola TaxID=2994950 RepID=A0ABU4DVY3_9DEIO|nr:NAD(P)-binding domain-containing protein [Deinococcus sp. ZS9-10]MDV6376615.1 NAD(P)-binding domain-containing protein [Deinococcus sp. ZS9-10]